MPSLYPPISAPSIRELAGKPELDPDALEATVSTFNAAVRPGAFDDTILDDCRTEGLTPPKSHWARRLDEAPFYAYPVRPGITFAYLGVRVNQEARIQMADGRGAPNMFAAGEIMAAQFERPDLGHPDEPGLGRRIDAAPFLAQRCPGRDVDDPAEAGLLHTRQERLQALQAATQVQRDGEIEMREALFLDRPRPHDAGRCGEAVPCLAGGVGDVVAGVEDAVG